MSTLTGMELTFRAAVEQDRPALEALNRAAYEGLVIAQFGNWDESFEAKIFDEKWAEQEFTIVERDGIMVAAVWTIDNGDHLWLREIQVAPIHQSRGLGTLLVNHVITEADLRSIPTRLMVLKKNRAITWYQRLGFAFTGKTTETHYWMRRDPLAGKKESADK